MAEPARRTDRAAAVLRRVLDLVERVLRAIRTLALASALAVGFAWFAWLLDRPPSEPAEWGARVVVLALALAPAAILGLFLAGVSAIRELPSRYSDLPADVRSRASDLRPVNGRRGGLLGTAGALIGLGRVALSSREVLSPYAVVAAALRPAVVLSALVAALVAAVEIPSALVVGAALLA